MQKKEQVENSYRSAGRKCIPIEKELGKGITFHQMHWYNFQHVNSGYNQESLISSLTVFSHNSKLYSINPKRWDFFFTAL